MPFRSGVDDTNCCVCVPLLLAALKQSAGEATREVLTVVVTNNAI
jgi:hypothetical protein